MLLGNIQQLVTCGTLPTLTLVRNFVQVTYGSCLEKNLTTRFLQYHLIYLKTLYLRNKDNLQKKKEYAP